MRKFLLCFMVLVGVPALAAKIEICHIPPGNPDNAHTIEVSDKAFKAHEKHGDFKGPCNSFCETHCQTDDPCTVINVCDPVTFTCGAEEDIDCDDNNPCTDTGRCENGACINDPIGGTCIDTDGSCSNSDPACVGTCDNTECKYCGNGVIEAGEECEFVTPSPDDGCDDSTCKLEECTSSGLLGTCIDQTIFAQSQLGVNGPTVPNCCQGDSECDFTSEFFASAGCTGDTDGCTQVPDPIPNGWSEIPEGCEVILREDNDCPASNCHFDLFCPGSCDMEVACVEGSCCQGEVAGCTQTTPANCSFSAPTSTGADLLRFDFDIDPNACSQASFCAQPNPPACDDLQVFKPEDDCEVDFFSSPGSTSPNTVSRFKQSSTICSTGYKGSNIQFACGPCSSADWSSPVADLIGGGAGSKLSCLGFSQPADFAANDIKVCAREAGGSGLHWDVDFLSHSSRSNGCSELVGDDVTACQAADQNSSWCVTPFGPIIAP